MRHDLNTTVVDTGTGQVSIPNSELSHERITMLGSDNQPQPRQPRTPAPV